MIIIYLFNMFYFFGYRIKKLRILNLSTSFTEKIFMLASMSLTGEEMKAANGQ